LKIFNRNFVIKTRAGCGFSPYPAGALTALPMPFREGEGLRGRSGGNGKRCDDERQDTGRKRKIEELGMVELSRCLGPIDAGEFIGELAVI